MKPIINCKKLKFALSGLMLVLLIALPASLSAQDSGPLKVTGTVLDFSSSETMPGVNIAIKGTQTGTVTDINGKFSIDALKGSVLVFSFIGFETTELIIDSKTSLNVRLKPTIESLEEVVVIGYGITTRKEEIGRAHV